MYYDYYYYVLFCSTFLFAPAGEMLHILYKKEGMASNECYSYSLIIRLKDEKHFYMKFNLINMNLYYVSHHGFILQTLMVTLTCKRSVILPSCGQDVKMQLEKVIVHC